MRNVLGTMMVLATTGGCALHGDALRSTPAATVPAAGVVLPDTESWSVHDPAGRDYPIWVALPASYAQHPERRYPVLFVTDALYSFPLVRSVDRKSVV